MFDGLARQAYRGREKVWTLLLALSVHEVLVFLSVGIETFELIKSLPKSVLVIFIFAHVSPVGIAIGELAQSVASAMLKA